jgi:DNA-binding response OmpR family regulator
MRVLVLEDEFLIAMEIEEILESAGAREVVVVGRVADALAVITDTRSIELAVLDIHLGSESSEAVALALMQRNIPFVFGTAMDSSIAVPDQLRHIPVVDKPYNGETLLAALEKARRASR